MAGVIREKTPASAAAEIKNCVYDGADMIDLHMSCLENTDTDALKPIISASILPVLALNYNKKYDWSDCGLSEDERVNIIHERNGLIMKAMPIDENKNLVWSDVETPTPKDDEILIKIHAAALNRADLLQRKGTYPSPEGWPEWPGLEVSSIIEDMGDKAKKESGKQIG